MSEMCPGQVLQLVGIGVATRQGVTQQLWWQLVRWSHPVAARGVVWLAGHAHDRVVPDQVAPGREEHAKRDVAVLVLELGRHQSWLEVEPLLANQLGLGVSRLDQDQDRRGL